MATRKSSKPPVAAASRFNLANEASCQLEAIFNEMIRIVGPDPGFEQNASILALALRGNDLACAIMSATERPPMGGAEAFAEQREVVFPQATG